MRRVRRLYCLRNFPRWEPTLKRAALICVAVSCLFTACDSDLGLSGSIYTVGGSVSGLTGSNLVLQYVSGTSSSNLTISANGSFAFSPHLASGTPYSITVESQPANPAQVCTVTNGSGTLQTVDVTDVLVSCGQTAKFAYVANKLSNNISAYSVNSAGALTPIAGSPFVSTGSQPDAVWIRAGGNYLYVANAGSNDLSVFSIATGTGLLNPQGTVPTGIAPYGIVVNPAGTYLYVSNYSSNDISAYAISSSSGALTEISGSPFPVGVAPTSIKTDPTGEFLYVANYGSDSVSVLQINSSSGALSDAAGSPFAARGGPISIAIDPTGAFVYVADATAATISEYSIDSSSGALTAIAGSPLATQSSPTALTIAGGSLIVADVTQANNVATFAIAGSGALSFSMMVQTGSSPVYLTIDPSGEFAYAVCKGTNNVFIYTVSGGTLTPASPVSVSAGTGPVSIAIN
jgi:6-phosphogluconolactonase